MPHSLIRDYKSNLSGIVGNALGRVQSFVYDYADDKILELEDKESMPSPKNHSQ